jgi:hypothetical protein
MRHEFPLCFSLFLAAASLLPASALASVVLDLSEAQLVARSDIIAVGSVVQTETHLNAQHQVRTDVWVQVHRPVRGTQEGELLRLSVPGGLYRGIMHAVDGVPKVAPGQLLVLFLQRSAQQDLRPLGLSLGVYYVDTDLPEGLGVRQNYAGLTLQRPRAAAAAVPRGQSIEPLATLLQRLDQTVAQLDPAEPGGAL